MTTADWEAIVGCIAESTGLAPAGLTVSRGVVVLDLVETRLRFNAPTPVRCLSLELVLGAEAAPLFSGEVEFFHWLSDGEWELIEMQGR